MNDLRKKIRYIVYSKFPLRAFKMEDLNEGIDQLLSLFQEKRIIQKLYLEQRKKVLTEVIELLEKMRYVKGSKELEIYTVNPLILELKALRGDFKDKGER